MEGPYIPLAVERCRPACVRIDFPVHQLVVSYISQYDYQMTCWTDQMLLELGIVKDVERVGFYSGVIVGVQI